MWLGCVFLICVSICLLTNQVLSANLNELYENGDFERLYNELKKCGYKNSTCIKIMGDMYYMGNYVDQDIITAISLWKVSSDLGNSDGQFNMGLAYLIYPSLDSLECRVFNKNNIYIEMLNEYDEIPCELYPYEYEYAELFFMKYKSIIENTISINEKRSDIEQDLYKNIINSIRLSNLYLYFSSLTGHTGSQLALGFRYETGLGLPKSCESAMSNYMEVAKETVVIQNDGIPSKEELIRLSIPNWEPMKKLYSKTENRNREDLAINLAESGNITIQLALAKRYLLGVDGFAQDVKKAYKYLRKIADKARSLVGVVLDTPSTLIYGEAIGLLGYIYALGIGTEKNLKIASDYFSISAFIYNDPGGHNGMGYIYFHGCEGYERNFRLSFHHFNESAFHLFADAQYNLASLYLTGIGTSQSYSEAITWYTRAFEQGHIPAAYALSQLNYNGLGINKDCNIALEFIKSVIYKSAWVSNIVKIINKTPDSNNSRKNNQLIFYTMKLALTGHEQSLSNLASLLDKDLSKNSDWGTSQLGLHLKSNELLNSFQNKFREISLKIIPSFIINFLTDIKDGKFDNSEIKNTNNWYLPQMFLEFSIYKENIDSIVRYGDYSYYGKGVSMQYVLKNDSEVQFHSWVRPIIPKIYSLDKPNYKVSFDLYRAAALFALRSRWMISSVSEACFNLGYMYQFGIGVDQNLQLAAQYYRKMVETGNINKISNGIGEFLVLSTKIHGIILSHKNIVNNLKQSKEVSFMIKSLFVLIILISLRLILNVFK